MSAQSPRVCGTCRRGLQTGADMWTMVWRPRPGQGPWRMLERVWCRPCALRADLNAIRAVYQDRYPDHYVAPGSPGLGLPLRPSDPLTPDPSVAMVP